MDGIDERLDEQAVVQCAIDRRGHAVDVGVAQREAGRHRTQRVAGIGRAGRPERVAIEAARAAAHRAATTLPSAATSDGRTGTIVPVAPSPPPAGVSIDVAAASPRSRSTSQRQIA